MLLSRVLLAGPIALPLLPPSAELSTDEVTYEAARGRVTACFSIDTLHTGTTGVAVSVCNPHVDTALLVSDDALVDWVMLDFMTGAPVGEHRFALESSEEPELWLSFVLRPTVIDALRVLRDAVPLEAAQLQRWTGQLQALVDAS
jgi:hypothetical protein